MESHGGKIMFSLMTCQMKDLWGVTYFTLKNFRGENKRTSSECHFTAAFDQEASWGLDGERA